MKILTLPHLALICTVFTGTTQAQEQTRTPTLTPGNQTPAGGWNNTAVDLFFTTDDDLSGVQSSDPGNSATFTSPAVNIDTHAPVVTAAANPATASKNPRPVTVTISGNATDNLSGISSASYNVIDEYGLTQPSGPVTVLANGSYSFTLSLPASKNGPDKDGHLYTIVVSALDRAGNAASATTTLRLN